MRIDLDLALLLAYLALLTPGAVCFIVSLVLRAYRLKDVPQARKGA